MENPEELTVLQSGVAEGVVVLTLNRPGRCNCFSLAMLDRLLQHLDELGRTRAARVIVLRGSGTMFCSGLDLREAMEGPPCPDGQPRGLVMVRRVVTLLHRLQSMDQTIVVAAHHMACGGGAGLVAVADFAFVDDQFRMSFPEVRRGLVPALLHPFLSRKYSPSALRYAMLTGESIGAADAVRYGFVERIVPADRLPATAMEFAESICRGDGNAVVQAKRLLNEQLIPTHAELEQAVEEHWKSWCSPSGQEGVRAFLEKK